MNRHCDYGRVKRHRVRVDGVQFHVEQEGSGPPMLLVHGGPGIDHRSLHPGLSVLADCRTLYYMDLRGHGGSPIPRPRSRWGLSVDADDLERVRRALKLDAPDLFGHSYGGAVVLQAAARRPDSFSKVIVCSTPLGATEAQIERRMGRDPRRTSSEGAPIDFEQYLRFYYERPADALTRKFAGEVRASYSTARNRRLLRLREHADKDMPDWEKLVRKVRSPVLVLHGLRDPIVPPGALRRLLRSRPAFRIASFDKSRHQPFDDERIPFRDLVTRFLGTTHPTPR